MSLVSAQYQVPAYWAPPHRRPCAAPSLLSLCGLRCSGLHLCSSWSRAPPRWWPSRRRPRHTVARAVGDRGAAQGVDASNSEDAANEDPEQSSKKGLSQPARWGLAGTDGMIRENPSLVAVGVKNLFHHNGNVSSPPIRILFATYLCFARSSTSMPKY